MPLKSVKFFLLTSVSCGCVDICICVNKTENNKKMTVALGHKCNHNCCAGIGCHALGMCFLSKYHRAVAVCWVCIIAHTNTERGGGIQ